MSYFLTSCEVINPAENIPAYIHIDSIQLQIDSAKQGTASHKISDAFVYLNGNYMGTYELPATFPVLAEGTQKISIGGGIMENGISATRKFYPFYLPENITISFEPKKTDTIFPIVHYNDYVNFTFIEDFESTGLKFTTLSSDTSVQRVFDPAIVFEGTACGGIFLADTITGFECASTEKFSIKPGATVYLEMNYLSNNSFEVGIMQSSNSAKSYKIVVNPKSLWNKIYINLSDEISILQGASFNLIFKAEQDDAATDAAIYWDNIKLIY